MLKILRKDTFIKDMALLLLVGILVSSVFAAGFALATDKYFAKAVTGVIGDFGQYDLLFQTREELKSAMARQIREVIATYFPGATLKSGISLAGKATFFLTLPSQYKTKAIFNSFGYYFNNLPGNGGYSVMTEPRITLTSVPAGIFEVLSKKVEEMPEVKFTFKDGGNIGVILKKLNNNTQVTAKIRELLNKYQILEVRLTSTASPEDLAMLSKKVSQSLIGIKGLDYVRDITMSSGTDDYQYMINTLSEVKKFLLAYAAEVKIAPNPGEQGLEIGNLLVMNGQNKNNIKPGSLLEPLEVVVKITAKDASGIHGLIIQGDASFLRDNVVYKLLTGDKIGAPVGTVEVSSRKSQLVYAMDQGVKLLTQLNLVIDDLNGSRGAGLTVDSIEKVYRQLAQVEGMLKTVESNITGLNGKVNGESLVKMVNTLNGVGDDLEYLAKTFGRVQILENRFSQALQGLQGTQFVLTSPLVRDSIGKTGGIAEKLQFLDTQLSSVEESLRDRVRKLDDFINRFNPLVAVLLSWRNKAQIFAEQINNFGTTFTPGSDNYQKLTGLIHATDGIIGNISGLDLPAIKKGFNSVSDRFFGSGKIDLAALIAQLEHVKDSLPRLLDEEIGHSVGLIDKYIGGDKNPGETIRIFTKAETDRELVDATIKDSLNNSQIGIFSLPAGAIQPDIRGELFNILAEVRSTIAALVLLILWALSFILDQSLIISMFKLMDLSLLPKKLEFGNRGLNISYRFILNLVNPANMYAFFIGGTWLVIAFALSGARIPYLNYFGIAILGGILGIVISVVAEKINPINKEEVLAGLSLGLPFKTIMREIVIPAGRPGMLQFLNRWKMVMK